MTNLNPTIKPRAKQLVKHAALIWLLALCTVPALAQDWPDVAQSTDRPCYLLGNFRGLAMKNQEFQVYIGKPKEPQNFTPFFNEAGVNLWTTDEFGVLCLGRQPVVPDDQMLLVVQDGLIGGLFHPSIPVILVNEEVEIDVALSDLKGDDILSTSTGGWLPARVTLSESLLEAGQVEVIIQSADLLFSNEIDPAGEMIEPAQNIKVVIVPEDPDEVFYIKPAGTDYPYDADRHYAAQLQIDVYRAGQAPANGRKGQVYATNQSAPIATGTETVTLTYNYVLYRGANIGANYLFEQAAQGKATPKRWGQPEAHASAVRHHSLGTNQSIFTSWSLSYNVAAKFAVIPREIPGQPLSASQGVILTKEVTANYIMKSPSTISSEQEVLQIGPVTADAITFVQLDDFERNPIDVMRESVTDGRAEDIKARIDALPQGMRWYALPEQESTCYFVAEETGDLLPSTTIAAWQVAPDGTETPILNNGENAWTVNEYGYVCFNMYGLAAGLTIKIEALYANTIFQGFGTHDYPIIFLNNNPLHLYPAHLVPGQGSEYHTKRGLKPFYIMAKVKNGVRNASGELLDRFIIPRDELMSHVQQVRLMVNGSEVPFNANIPEDDFNYIPNPYQSNEFTALFTPPGYGTYVFTPELTLTNGVVVKDPKPVNIVVIPQGNQAGLTGGVGVVGIGGGTGARTTTGASSLHLAMVAQPASFTFDTAEHVNTGQGLAIIDGAIHVPLQDLSSRGAILATGSNPDSTTFELPFHYAYDATAQAEALTTPNRQTLTNISATSPVSLVSYDYTVIRTGLPTQANRISRVVSCHQQAGTLQGTLQLTYTDTLSQAELNAIHAYRWHTPTSTWQPVSGGLVVNTNTHQVALPIGQGGTYALFTEAPKRYPTLAVDLSVSAANGQTVQLAAQPVGNLPPNYVQFYANGVLVGTDYTAPFQWAWQPPASGQYTFEAIPWHSQRPGTPAIAEFTHIRIVEAGVCPETIAVTSFEVDTLYRSVQQTTASALVVPAWQSLQLQSAGKVVLKPGFHAVRRSRVLAALVTCQGHPLRRMGEDQANTAAAPPTSQAMPGSPLQTSVYPNPYLSTINIEYNVPAPGQLTIQLYSMEGTLLKTVVSHELLAPTMGTVPVNLEAYPNQLMLLVVQHPAGTQVHKIIRR